MATTSFDPAAVLHRKTAERRLYLGAAILAVLVVAAGFARTYYLKAAFGTPELSALKHAHGLVMTTWFALFLVQVSLVAAGRTDVHRRLGAAGIVVAILVVIVGTMTALAAARSGVSPPGAPPALIFLVIPLGDMAIFALLFSAAIAYRQRPDIHKRLMLLASLSMLTAAIARIPLDFLAAGGLPAFFITTDLLILACVAYDTVRNRRLHPAFLAGVIVVIGSQGGRILLAGTPQWTQWAKWMVG